MEKRKIIDLSLLSITYIASFISAIILGFILVFVFSRGSKLLSFDIITANYNSSSYLLSLDEVDQTLNFNNPNIENTYFSSRFGISLRDDYQKNGDKAIRIIYIASSSPLRKMQLANNQFFELREGLIFESTMNLVLDDGTSITVFSKDGAMNAINTLNETKIIKAMRINDEGGGIRGSIITTLYLIIITLIIGLPIGIFTALYLHEIAKESRLKTIIRSFVDMLTGVPSIIFGLMGAAFFIPLTTKIFNNESMRRGSLIAGSLTLVVIILPVLIKATESALDVIPREYKEASLALGANTTQTCFKVLLKGALPGILSATLLSIGRIVGESAALIYAMGTIISDDISITGRSTSLSVHIWTIMGGEIPNVNLACTIAIIILVFVLTLNLFVKIITSRFIKKYRY